MPNIGTLTGLTPSTEYVLDAVHVDAWGNVSAVASSPPFTTGVASAGPTVSDTTGSPIITVNHDNGGTLGTLYQFDVDGSITFSTGGDVEYAMVGGGAPGGMSSGALRAGGGGGGGKVRQGTTTVAAATLGIVVAAATDQSTAAAADLRQAPFSSFNGITAQGGWEGGHFTGGVADPGGSGPGGHGGGGTGGGAAAGGSGGEGFKLGRQRREHQ
jgi:hypothetical protein